MFSRHFKCQSWSKDETPLKLLLPIGNTVRHFLFRETPRQKAVSFKIWCPFSMPSKNYHVWNLKYWSQLRPRTHTAFVSNLQSRCHDGKSEWLDTLHCCINFPRVLYEVSVTGYLMTYVTIYYRHNHIYYAVSWPTTFKNPLTLRTIDFFCSLCSRFILSIIRNVYPT